MASQRCDKSLSAEDFLDWLDSSRTFWRYLDYKDCYKKLSYRLETGRQQCISL